MKRIGSIIVLAGILSGGCKKEPLPQAVPGGEPVFYASCAINNVNVRLEAGNKGYELVPGFSMDSNNVYVLESTISSPSCADCYSMKIMINDHMVSVPGEPIHIDSALKRGFYVFNDRSSQPTQYKVDLKPEMAEDPTGTYKWIVSEPNKEDVVFSGYNLHLTLNALTAYSLALQYQDATGCTSTHNNLLKLGAGPAVNVTASRLSTSELKYKFVAEAAATPIHSFHWEFGDGSSSQEPAPEHVFEPGNGYYEVTLRATNAGGEETITRYQVPAVADPVCTSNYDAVITPVPNHQNFSKVTVEITEPSGKVYSSRDFLQPSESSFEIVSIEDYYLSAGGLKTKRFKVHFNCTLQTGGSQIRITGGEAMLAVGYE